MNLYTKFEVSILNGGGDIFDEKSGEKEKGTNIVTVNRTSRLYCRSDSDLYFW